MRMTQVDYLQSGSGGAFLECLGVWTACIGGGRIVLTHGTGNILGMSTSLQ
jgi:hypothetical protein